MLLVAALSPAALGQSAARKTAPRAKLGATTASVEQTLMKLEHEWAEALVRRDVGALDRIMADEVVGVDSSGAVWSKAQLIANVKSGNFATEVAAAEGMTVRVYGNTAVVTGRYSDKSNYRGRDTSVNARFVDVFVKRAGRWQAVASQETAITPREITTPSGLRYSDLVEGNGPSPEPGRRVTVHYIGTFVDGRKFDSSVDHGGPYTFVIGMGRVIKGWDEGVMTMKVGGKRRLVVPANLGYGAEGAGGGAIPPNATLIFEVELLAVK